MASDAGLAASAVAARIRELRSELGLNQTEFARALGVSRSSISDAENNSVKITVDLLLTIGEVFGQKSPKAGVIWLITGDERSVPWGENPELSPLNQVLALDRRALVYTLRVLYQIDQDVGRATPSEQRAALFIHVLYTYMSEMERSVQSGAEPDVARALAEGACTGLGAALGDLGSDKTAGSTAVRQGPSPTKADHAE
jgi:transcriptional regulator with XRE-family HTH domain